MARRGDQPTAAERYARLCAAVDGRSAPALPGPVGTLVGVCRRETPRSASSGAGRPRDDLDPEERALARADSLNEQLHYALNSRVVIEQAKDAVARALGVGVEEAFVGPARG